MAAIFIFIKAIPTFHDFLTCFNTFIFSHFPINPTAALRQTFKLRYFNLPFFLQFWSSRQKVLIYCLFNSYTLSKR